MQKRISFFLLLVAFFASVLSLPAHAANFSVSKVTVIDDKSVALSFSDMLSENVVRVRIIRTKDSDTIDVLSVVRDESDRTRAIITLADRLDPSSSYSLVVISASSSDGRTITDGVDSIAEFATTASLVHAPETTTDTTNSGAVMVTTGSLTTTGTEAEITTMTGVDVSTGQTTTSSTDDALPETGPSSLFLVLVAIFGVFGFTLLRSRARA